MHKTDFKSLINDLFKRDSFFMGILPQFSDQIIIDGQCCSHGNIIASNIKL